MVSLNNCHLVPLPVSLSVLHPCLLLRLFSVLFIKQPHESFFFLHLVHLFLCCFLPLHIFLPPLSLSFHRSSTFCPSSLRPVRMVTRSTWSTSSSMGRILPPRMPLETLPCTSVLYITRWAHFFPRG